LLAGGIDAAEALGKALEGADDAVEKGLPARVEHAHEIKPERLGEQQERAEEEGELEPGVGRVHGRSL